MGGIDCCRVEWRAGGVVTTSGLRSGESCGGKLFGLAVWLKSPRGLKGFIATRVDNGYGDGQAVYGVV